MLSLNMNVAISCNKEQVIIEANNNIMAGTLLSNKKQ